MLIILKMRKQITDSGRHINATSLTHKTISIMSKLYRNTIIINGK